MIHPAKNAIITCDFCGRKVAEIVKSLFRSRTKVVMSHITVPFKYSDCKQTTKSIHICIACHEHLAAEIILKNAREKKEVEK